MEKVPLTKGTGVSGRYETGQSVRQLCPAWNLTADTGLSAFFSLRQLVKSQANFAIEPLLRMAQFLRLPSDADAMSGSPPNSVSMKSKGSSEKFLL